MGAIPFALTGRIERSGIALLGASHGSFYQVFAHIVLHIRSVHNLCSPDQTLWNEFLAVDLFPVRCGFLKGLLTGTIRQRAVEVRFVGVWSQEAGDAAARRQGILRLGHNVPDDAGFAVAQFMQLLQAFLAGGLWHAVVRRGPKQLSNRRVGVGASSSRRDPLCSKRETVQSSCTMWTAYLASKPPAVCGSNRRGYAAW